MRPNKVITSLLVVFVCALATSGVFLFNNVGSDGGRCPSDWPDQSYVGPLLKSDRGTIDYQGFHTDGEGEEWYIIRSSDSNGYTTVRAYEADDSYSGGYRVGSPDEVCYLMVRRSEAEADAAEPSQVVFQKEQEEPERLLTMAPSDGDQGGTDLTEGDMVAILAAALEISRHSGALVAADLPASRPEILQYAGMVTAREAAMNAQLATLAGRGHDARVAEIRTLVNQLVSNAKAIQAGRPALLLALQSEIGIRDELTQINRNQLFPNADESMDEQFYSLVSSLDDGSASSGNASSADVLRYTHLSSLSSNAVLSQTFLTVASLMRDPTYVARIRESYDSVADRIGRDIEYLAATGDSSLEQMVLRYARQSLNAGIGSGQGNYFVRLESRLKLVAAENDRIDDNAHTLARLRDEIGRLTADVLGREHPTPETMPEEVDDNPGVTDTEVRFGQSAALTGPSAVLGTQMEIGIRAAFSEANAAGGVHGRTLNLLTTLDDRYEPDAAFANTQKLIEEEQVFGLIGAVGTPTSRAASPLANAEGVPFIAPFTGAQLLRDDALTNVLNLRASYHQETQRMVEYLAGRGLTQVAVLYQNDSYGVDGLMGVEQALDGHGLDPVGSWYYRRNTTSVQSAVYRIAAAEPQAVIIIGASDPAAQAIKLLREKLGSDTIFMNVSFVGSDALAAELATLGESSDNVFFTQVVPLPGNTSDPLIAKYRAALTAYDAQAEHGFVSLEGYLAGRLAIEGLERCGANVTRTCFLNAVQTAGTFDLDGYQLMFGSTDNQGSDAVFLTQIDGNGNYQLVP